MLCTIVGGIGWGLFAICMIYNVTSGKALRAQIEALIAKAEGVINPPAPKANP